MKKTVFALALLGFLASCSDDEENDTQAPQILSATINGEDHDISHAAGQALQYAAELSDNEELKELKIDFHDRFDGHDHGKKLDGNAWSDIVIASASGASQTVSGNITVPSDVLAGPYHATFRALDASGNESEFKEVNFVITNGDEPVFSISSPNFDAEIDGDKGQNLVIEGTLTDNVDLVELTLIIEEDHDDHSHKMSAALVEIDQDFPGTADTSFDLSQLSILIPANAADGDYKISLMAKDNEGNYGYLEGKVHIH